MKKIVSLSHENSSTTNSTPPSTPVVAPCSAFSPVGRSASRGTESPAGSAGRGTQSPPPIDSSGPSGRQSPSLFGGPLGHLRLPFASELSVGGGVLGSGTSPDAPRDPGRRSPVAKQLDHTFLDSLSPNIGGAELSTGAVDGPVSEDLFEPHGRPGLEGGDGAEQGGEPQSGTASETGPASQLVFRPVAGIYRPGPALVRQGRPHEGNLPAPPATSKNSSGRSIADDGGQNGKENQDAAAVNVDGDGDLGSGYYLDSNGNLVRGPLRSALELLPSLGAGE